MQTRKWLQRTESLPPWHPCRSRILIEEVRPYIAKMYNVNVADEDVEEWATKGMSHPSLDNTRVYLKLHKFCGRLMIHKVDLNTFLEIS